MCGPIQGTPTTSASSGSSTWIPRSPTVRTSASACATDGLPAKAAVVASATVLLAQHVAPQRRGKQGVHAAQRRRRDVRRAIRACAGSRGSAPSTGGGRARARRRATERALRLPPRLRARAPRPTRPPPGRATLPQLLVEWSPRRTRRGARPARRPRPSRPTRRRRRGRRRRARVRGAPRSVLERDGLELRVGGVVDDDPAAERTRLRWREEPLQVALAELPARARRTTRIVWRSSGTPLAVELVEDRRERLAARVGLGARERQRRRLDHDGNAPAAPALARRTHARRAESGGHRAPPHRRRRRVPAAAAVAAGRPRHREGRGRSATPTGAVRGARLSSKQSSRTVSARN